MKKTGIFMMVLVLSLSVLTGCGCRNSKPMATTTPTTLPVMTTTPTTQFTTGTTMDTEPTESPTIQDGNGPASTDTTMPDDTSGSNNRSRSNGMISGAGSSSGITGSIN